MHSIPLFFTAAMVSEYLGALNVAAVVLMPSKGKAFIEFTTPAGAREVLMAAVPHRNCCVLQPACKLHMQRVCQRGVLQRQGQWLWTLLVHLLTLEDQGGVLATHGDALSSVSSSSSTTSWEKDCAVTLPGVPPLSWRRACGFGAEDTAATTCEALCTRLSDECCGSEFSLRKDFGKL